jgi:hypothetical protein
VKEIPLNSSGRTVSLGNEFADGIFIMKLVADGKMIDQLKAVKAK